MKDGETLQRFFVHQNHWSKGADFDVKLWEKDSPLLPRMKGDVPSGDVPSYRLPLGTGGEKQP